MKIKVIVGGIKVQTEGLDLTKRDVLRLLRAAGSVAMAIIQEDETEPERAPMGFTAVIERAPDFGPDYSEYFEDEE
jgi:hypothetical protein